MAKRRCTVTGRGTCHCDGHESLGHRPLRSDGKNWRAHFFSVSGGLVQMLLFCVILSILATSTVALLSNITGASVGVGHTCAFNTSGSAFCWGYNYYGQIGDNSTIYNFYGTTYASAPVQVAGLTSGVSKIICGDYFSCAIVTPGALSCWGSNAYGQLGDGTFIDKYVPTPVMNMSSGVTYASAGSAHMCAIKSSTVWCWGSNILAALGQGTCCGAPSSVPLPVSLGGVNATAVAAGAGHTCALRTDGSAFCWGSNGYGQIGSNGAMNTMILTPTAVFGGNTFTNIFAGFAHTCGSTASAVKCWGDNSYGQLGLSSITQSATPIQVLAVAASTVTAGAYFSCATTSTGISCWGQNNYGQLGLGYYNITATVSSPQTLSSLMNSSSAVVVGGTVHACAVASNNMYCWGYNGEGELGLCSLIPASVALPRRVEYECPFSPVAPVVPQPVPISPPAKCGASSFVVSFGFVFILAFTYPLLIT